MSEIKVIVSDLDGTLLDNNHEISAVSSRVLQKVQAKGIGLVIASGRSYQQIKDICKDLKMDEYKNGYIVGTNGLELYSFKDNAYHKLSSIDERDILSILKYCRYCFLQPIYLSDQSMYVYQVRSQPVDLQKIKSDGYDIANVEYRSLLPHQKPNEMINKICVKCPTSFINTFISYIRFLFKGKYAAFRVSKNWVEIMPNEINKALRIKEILKNETLSSEEIMVFGDSQNDIEMLSLTSNSYAMDNALQEVKKIANYSAATNHQNGVAQVVSQRILEKF